MNSEKEVLIEVITGESVPSTPNTQQQPRQKLNPALLQMNSIFPDPNHSSTPLIEMDPATPREDDHAISPKHRARVTTGDSARLEPNRLTHSGSRHSLSKLVSQNKRRVAREQQATPADSAHGEVQHMEHDLLQLLDQFNSGKLRAFDTDYSLDQMESIRDQQEALARKHFELGAQLDLHPPLSDDGLKTATDNMAQLISSLEKLSSSIGQLSCLDRMSATETDSVRVPSDATLVRQSIAEVPAEMSRESSLETTRVSSRKSSIGHVTGGSRRGSNRIKDGKQGRSFFIETPPQSDSETATQLSDSQTISVNLSQTLSTAPHCWQQIRPI